jgi:hypothetical protein
MMMVVVVVSAGVVAGMAAAATTTSVIPENSTDLRNQSAVHLSFPMSCGIIDFFHIILYLYF